MTAAMGSGPDLHAVAVCYHLDPATFAQDLQRIARGAGRPLRGVVVSNNPAHALPPSRDGLEFVRGTNAHLDFSGFFEGMERLAATNPSAGWGNVLFVNDTLFTKHAGGTILRRVLAMSTLMGQLAVPAMCGKRDPYRSICLSNPWSGQAGYVSSFCFLLNAAALPFLARLPADAADDGVLAAAPVRDAKWADRVPAAMRELIRAHLVYEGSPYLWPNARPCDAELTHKKARCVYFEQRLSGAIGKHGALVPINSGPRSRVAIFARETLARAARALKATP